jgi:hypothetical protein
MLIDAETYFYLLFSFFGIISGWAFVMGVQG